MPAHASAGATGGDGQSPTAARPVNGSGDDDADMQHTSQYLGVSWSAEAQKWRVSVVWSPSQRDGGRLMGGEGSDRWPFLYIWHWRSRGSV